MEVRPGGGRGDPAEDPRVTPTGIRQAGPRELEISWADGHTSVYDVAYLRRHCRCAACVDEWSGKRLLDPNHIPGDVKPRDVRRVGRYAIHFDWSDGHTSGIYTFEHLRGLCPCASCRGAAGTGQEL